MTTKGSIRVIKRAQRGAGQPASPVDTQTKPSADPARQMIDTVTKWVRELQDKRQAESKRLIQNLFKEPNPLPREAC
jgi:hypothetical protein